jgi:membrane fusion protein (multidrug efflux system)
MRRASSRKPILLGLLAVAFACGGDTNAPAPLAPPVAVKPVRVADVLDEIEATGQLLARDRATIAAEVGGRITAVEIYEGRGVEVGDVVLKIDPERRELEVKRARAELEGARANFLDGQREWRRFRALKEKDFAAQARLEEAEAELAAARSRLGASEAQVGVAERALADAEVRAPFAGLVADRMVSVGEYVQTSQPLFELVALDPIEVEFHLAEIDSARVHLGDTVRVLVAPFPDEAFPATVTFISPVINPRSRTLRVKGRIDNGDGRLRPGLFARADLGVSERKGVTLVPEEAILQRADGAVLFRLGEGDFVERLVVETGTHRQGDIEVVSGIRPGDSVVIRGHAALVDGSRVSVRDLDGNPAPPAVANGLGNRETSE